MEENKESLKMNSTSLPINFLIATAYNRAYLATCIQHSAQIPRFAWNFRYARDVKRPRKDKKLPVVLSEEEVAEILSDVDNIKHKAILMLMYSGVLRVGEVIKLKPEDIDANRKLIRIKASKGRKDRYTLLSDVVLQTLREYWKKERPKKWLFPSWNIDKHITTRTVEKFFKTPPRKQESKKM